MTLPSFSLYCQRSYLGTYAMKGIGIVLIQEHASAESSVMMISGEEETYALKVYVVN